MRKRAVYQLLSRMAAVLVCAWPAHFARALEVSVPADVPGTQVIAPGGSGSFGYTARNPDTGEASGDLTAQFNWSTTDPVDILAEYAFVPDPATPGCAAPIRNDALIFRRITFRIDALAGGASRTCRYRLDRAVSSRYDVEFSLCDRTDTLFCGPAGFRRGTLPDLVLSIAPEGGDPSLLRITVANATTTSLEYKDASSECAEFEGGLFEPVPIDLVNDFPGACPTGSAGLEGCLSFTGQNFTNRAFRVGPLPAGGSASCLVRVRNTGFASDDAVAFQLIRDPAAIVGGGGAFDANPMNDDALLGVPVSVNRQAFTNSYYEIATSGQGFVLEFSPAATGNGQVFGGWFTHSADGSATRWYSLQGAAPADASGAPLVIYANQGGNFASGPPTTAVAVGTATLTFFNCREGSLVYRFNDGSASGSITLQRLVASTNCPLDAQLTQPMLRAGAWFDPATSGQGATVSIAPDGTSYIVFAAWYTYVPNGAQVGGLDSQRWYSLQGRWDPTTSSVVDVQIFETRGGRFDQARPPTQQTTQVGTGTIDFRGCNDLRLAYTFTGGASAGRTGTLQLVRTGPVPAGCR